MGGFGSWLASMSGAMCSSCGSDSNTARMEKEDTEGFLDTEQLLPHPEPQEPVREEPKRKKGSCIGRCLHRVCCAICCILFLIFLIYAIALGTLVKMSADRYVNISPEARRYTDMYLTMKNITHSIEWPGCGQATSIRDIHDDCASPCYASDLPKGMDKFNEEHPGIVVSYLSREHELVKQTTLRGWWLPAGKLVVPEPTTTITTTTTTTSTTTVTKTTTTQTSTTKTATTTTTTTMDPAILKKEREEELKELQRDKDKKKDDKDDKEETERRLKEDKLSERGHEDNNEPEPVPAPAHDGAAPPRIILVPSMQANSWHVEPQLVAYMLRDLGFDVLVTDYRDYGLSEQSRDQIQQGSDVYPYDVLGAWDFARNDPYNFMGGPVPAEKVGIIGLASGGMVVLDAFGMEGDIPAIWVDSSPVSMHRRVVDETKEYLETLGLPEDYAEHIMTAFLHPTWYVLEGWARLRGSSFMRYTPEKELPYSPDTERRVAVVHNKADMVVEEEEATSLLKLLGSYPKKFEVHDWDTDGTCHGSGHLATMFFEHNIYKTRLCEFWRATFDMDPETCLPDEDSP